jgi:excisionase family DNA binding protein
MQTQSETHSVPRLAWRVNELAEAVGLSERQIYRLQEDGTLTGFKVGRARLISADSVQRWLTSAQEVAAA